MWFSEPHNLIILCEKKYKGFHCVLFWAENPDLEEIDVDSLLETLEQRKDKSVASPTSVSSVIYL